MAGAPLGNTNSAKGRPWRDAIDWALDNYEKEGKVARNMALREIALKLVDTAVSGDMVAIRELGDRIEGKAVQPIAGDQDNPIAVTVNKMLTEVLTIDGQLEPQEAIEAPTPAIPTSKD